VACQWGHGRRRPVRRRRYTCDTSDAEWQVIAPLLPWPAWLDGRGGRPEEYCRRQVVDAIFYIADNGCKWRNLPADFPPWRTVHAIFTRWWRDGDVDAIHNDLREQVRRAEGRDADPTAAIIDSQSIRAAETVGAASRGYDAGKKVAGANGTSSPTASACCWSWWSPPPACKTATVPGPPWNTCGSCSPPSR
jgi:transposase